MGIRTSNKQKGAKESMKYPDISKAVEQEILASYDKLYRLAFSYVKNEQDAMDVVQESVYKAMKNASQIKEKKYIKTWLWRIVINTAVDATRRQSRFVSDDQVQEEGQEDRYEDTDIMAALDTLEEKERKVIMLKVFEEWTIREMNVCCKAWNAAKRMRVEKKKNPAKRLPEKVNGIKRKVTCFRLSAWQKQWRQQLQCWSSVSMSVQQWLMQWNRCQYLVRLLKS